VTTQYQILYWRDIPAQVKIRAGSKRTARRLSDRFQEGIDEAAMRAKVTGTDEYLAAWRRSEWQERDSPPDVLADALVTELEAAYPEDRVLALVQNEGHDPQISVQR
jgi:Virulence factor